MPRDAVGRYRLHVDWTRCDGHGSCAELLPELLSTDPWGYPVPRDGSTDPGVPRTLEEHARHAVAACPLLALSLLPAAPPAASTTATTTATTSRHR